MTHSIQHPFDNTIYTLMDSGEIRITDGEREAWFHQDGRWIKGDFRQADPQMCVWVGNRPDPAQAGVSVQRRHTLDTHTPDAK